MKKNVCQVLGACQVVGHSGDLGVVDGDERAQHLVERDGGRRVAHGLARQRLEEHAVRELPHLPNVINAVKR